MYISILLHRYILSEESFFLWHRSISAPKWMIVAYEVSTGPKLSELSASILPVWLDGLDIGGGKWWRHEKPIWVAASSRLGAVRAIGIQCHRVTQITPLMASPLLSNASNLNQQPPQTTGTTRLKNVMCNIPFHRIRYMRYWCLFQCQLSSSNSNSKKAGNMKLLFGFLALILIILSHSLLSPDSHHSAQASCNWPGTHLVVPGSVWYRLSSRLIPNAWVKVSQNKIQSHQDASWHSDFWAGQFEIMPGNVISKSVTPGCGRSQPKEVPFIQVAQPALLHVSWATLLVFPPHSCIGWF